MISFLKFFTLTVLLLHTVFACTNNFGCQTLCCNEGKCVDGSSCAADNTRIYIGISIVAFVFLLAALIYMFFNLKEIRQNVHQMQVEMGEKEEQNQKILSNNENVKEE